MESGASALTPSQSNELHFLRSRVRELERERAELSAENQRLKTMLVHGECGSKRPAPPVWTCDIGLGQKSGSSWCSDAV